MADADSQDDGKSHPRPRVLPLKSNGHFSGSWRDADFVKFWVSRAASNFGALMGALYMALSPLRSVRKLD